MLVTQGTIRNEDDLLFAPTFAGLAEQDLLVIATTGGGTELAGALPANLRVEEFVPYAKLMPHVSVYVTNGGYGGVQMALSHGVPIVVCGATEDKPEVGARVAWSGAGVRVKSARPVASEIRRAALEVLSNPSSASTPAAWPAISPATTRRAPEQSSSSRSPDPTPRPAPLKV